MLGALMGALRNKEAFDGRKSAARFLLLTRARRATLSPDAGACCADKQAGGKKERKKKTRPTTVPIGQKIMKSGKKERKKRRIDVRLTETIMHAPRERRQVWTRFLLT